jgi:hypothetical protein
MSTYDLENVKIRAGEDSIDGVDSLPIEFEETVNKTFETGKIVEPPERKTEPPKKPRKARAKKSAVEEEAGENATEATHTTVKIEEPEHELDMKPDLAGPPPLLAKKVSGMRSKVKEAADTPEAIEPKDAAAPAAKPKPKKSRAKKRPIKEVDASSEEEVEYIPKKSRSRSIPFKEAVGLA